MGWTVHKFGGTSLADASCFRRVAEIVTRPTGDNVAVVVSAMRGTTDQLLNLVELAAKRQPVGDVVAGLRERYAMAARELLAPAAADSLLEQFEKDLADIESVLKALSLVRAASDRSRALISGFGELWSARLLAALLPAQVEPGTDVRFVDAREVLVIEAGEMGPIVAWAETRPRLERVLSAGFSGVAVITGFIAVDREGLPATLGRNGTDYSASIFGALLGANEVEIWTDVDGVMSADPRRVPEATVIDEISYNEAMELAYFGAKVIHPQTMAPALAHGIPLRIRNTFNVEHLGTRITAASKHRELVVKGVSGVDSVALINLEGAGMIGVPGTADRLFGALREPMSP
jgi:aspartokinase/homoserine dehydrogenase 1